MKKSNRFFYFKIFIFVIIIIASAIITKSVKEAYPSLILDYETTEEQHLQSKLDGTNTIESERFIQNNTFIKEEIACTSDTLILYPDETRINEGDSMIIKASWVFEKGEQSYWAGVHQEELVNIKPGNQGDVIGFVYYKQGKNKIYTRHCFNYQYESNVSFTPDFEIKRPSFVDSGIGSLVVFFGTIVLLGEFFRLFMYIIEEKS